MTQAPMDANFGSGGGSLPPITVSTKPNFSKLARVTTMMSEGTVAPARPVSVDSLYDDDSSDLADHAVPVPAPHRASTVARTALVEETTTLGALIAQMGLSESEPTPAPRRAAPVPRAPERGVVLDSSGLSNMARLARSVVKNIHRSGA